LDPASVHFDYQANDKSWHALEALPNNPEMFRLPEKASWCGMLRVAASDRAENTTTREINGSAWLAAKAQPAAPPVVATAPTEPAPFPVHVDSHLERTGATVGPDLVPPVQPAAATPAPAPMPSQQVVVNAGSREQGPAARDTLHPNRQLINNTHVVLDYRIDQVGPSGVSKVEIWMTGDEGKTWQHLCDDPDRKSPAEFDLPREGLYGRSLVVTNGNSISDPPPTAGTVPDWWIEVDTTRPQAQLLSVRPGTAEDAGTLVITWAASDKNLGT